MAIRDKFTTYFIVEVRSTYKKNKKLKTSQWRQMKRIALNYTEKQAKGFMASLPKHGSWPFENCAREYRLIRVVETRNVSVVE